MSEVSAEAGTTGLRVTIKRQVAAAAMLLHADEINKPARSPNEQQALTVDKAQEIVNLVMNAATPQAIQKVTGAIIGY